jgi:prepilin-type N-terminal cleavage/methylation domain-containing protein
MKGSDHRQNCARRSQGQRRGGYTLVEILVVLALAGVMSSVGIPLFKQMIHRTKLEAIARETAVFMQASRLSAIRESRTARVRVDTATARILAFVDEDGDGLQDIDEASLGSNWLPSGVVFAEPSGQTGIDSVLDFEIDTDVAIVSFNPDGSVASTGAVRFADSHDNFLEVAVASRTTGQIEVRKWNGTTWATPGEGGKQWQWN